MKKLLINCLIILSVFSHLYGKEEADSSAQKPMFQKNQIKAIVFDFDEVVAVTNRSTITNFVAEYFGISPRESVNALNRLRDAVADGMSEEEFWKQFAVTKRGTLTPEWAQDWEKAKLSAIEEISGTIAIAKNLKEQGYIVALLSNVKEERASLLRTHGFYDHFSPLLFSYEIGIEKPDPRVYEILLAELKLPAQEVIFIDQKQSNIPLARACGIDGIRFISPGQLHNELMKRGIDSNLELKKPNKALSLILPSKK